MRHAREVTGKAKRGTSIQQVTHETQLRSYLPKPFNELDFAKNQRLEQARNPINPFYKDEGEFLLVIEDIAHHINVIQEEVTEKLSGLRKSNILAVQNIPVYDIPDLQEWTKIDPKWVEQEMGSQRQTQVQSLVETSDSETVPDANPTREAAETKMHTSPLVYNLRQPTQVNITKK